MVGECSAVNERAVERQQQREQRFEGAGQSQGQLRDERTFGSQTTSSLAFRRGQGEKDE